MTKRYKLLRERFGNPPGTEVYPCTGYDYGLVQDDDIAMGKRHLWVTLKEDGDYPGFTVPMDDVELVS